MFGIPPNSTNNDDRHDNDSKNNDSDNNESNDNNNDTKPGPEFVAFLRFPL